MPQDPLGFQIVGGSTPPPQTNTPAPTTDPMGFQVVGSGAPKSDSEPAAPKTDSLGFQIVSPENGQEQDTTIGQRFKQAWTDPSKGVLGHIWNTLNTPVVDIDSALGRTGQAGGIEKGANDLASGLTSPLSIALTIGTLGLGGLVEAGGASVLRTVGMAAPEIEEVTKGAQIVKDATSAGHTFQEGLEAAKAAGVDPATLTKGLQALKAASLDSSSLLSKGIVRNSATALASKLGLSAKTADTVGQGLQFLTTAGFTAQQATQAAELSPRVLDALKDAAEETDPAKKQEAYSLAERLAVDAIGSAALGGLGAHETLKESGGLMDDLAAKTGLKVKPSAENLILRNEAGRYASDIAEAGRTQELWEHGLRKEYPKMSPVQLERVRYLVEAGNDEDVMASRRNAVAEASGRDEKIDAPAVEGPVPENGQSPQATTSGLSADRLREIIDQKNIASKYKPEQIDRLLDAYDPSKLADADRTLAKEIRSKFAETLDFAHQKDALADGQGIKDYVTSLYEKGDEDNPATNQLVHEAGSGAFQTQTSMARQRIFDNAFEAQLFGKKLSETDPIKLAAHNANVFQKVVAAREMKERLLDAGTRASDGMPLLAHSGDATPVTDEEGSAVMVNPRGIRSTKIADKVVQGLRDSGDLDRLAKSGKIRNLTRTITPDNIPETITRLEKSMIAKNPQFDPEGNSVMMKNIQMLKDVRDGKLPKSALDDFNAQRPDAYAWNPGAANYQVIDSPSMRDWKYLAQSPSGDSVVMKSDLMAHPEAAEYLKRILGVDKDAGTGVISKVASKINQEAKGVLLFGSPFHVMQIALRGVMSGVSPFRALDKWDIANDPKLRLGVQQSLTLGKNYHNMAAFSEGGVAGHSAIIGKIPGLNRIQTSLNSFLFDKYIPTMKVDAYRSLYNRYETAHPEWTAPRVAREAAEDTNERFGGLNYRDLGRAASTQNWFKLLALAPDWFESEARSILRPFHPDSSVSRTDMARIAAYMWTGSRVLNMLVNNGHPHMEAPFGVVYKQDNGKSNVISMRSLPSDLLHAVSDPLGFIRGRMSPLVRTGNEVYSGRDSFGRKLNHGDLVMDMLHNQLPIPGQAIGKAVTGTTPEVGNAGQLLNAGGFTDTIYRTEAQKLAAQLASDRSESGPVDTAQLARHSQLMTIEDQLRAGKLTHQQVQDLYIDGHITQAEKGKIDKNFTQTKGLPADQAQLLIRASRLAAPDLLKIWDLSTPSEKVVLSKTMANAKTKYINRAVKEMTPAQRQDDPTVKRLRSMFVQPQLQ